MKKPWIDKKHMVLGEPEEGCIEVATLEDEWIYIWEYQQLGNYYYEQSCYGFEKEKLKKVLAFAEKENGSTVDK